MHLHPCHHQHPHHHHPHLVDGLFIPQLSWAAISLHFLTLQTFLPIPLPSQSWTLAFISLQSRGIPRGTFISSYHTSMDASGPCAPFSHFISAEASPSIVHQATQPLCIVISSLLALCLVDSSQYHINIPC